MIYTIIWVFEHLNVLSIVGMIQPTQVGQAEERTLNLGSASCDNSSFNPKSTVIFL